MPAADPPYRYGFPTISWDDSPHINHDFPPQIFSSRTVEVVVVVVVVEVTVLVDVVVVDSADIESD